MCTTPAANSAKAAPRGHSPPDVFLAVRRRASRPCSRMRSGPTAPSLRQGHFGCYFEADKLAAAGSRPWHPSLRTGCGLRRERYRLVRELWQGRSQGNLGGAKREKNKNVEGV